MTGPTRRIVLTYRYRPLARLSRREFTISVLGTAAAATRVATATQQQTGSATASTAPSRSAADTLAGLTLSEVSARIKAGTLTSQSVSPASVSAALRDGAVDAVALPVCCCVAVATRVAAAAVPRTEMVNSRRERRARGR